MTITLEQAKSLKVGKRIYHKTAKNADMKTPQTFKVNGTPRTWKRDGTRVLVPLKRGLREYCHLTEDNLDEFTLTAE